MIRCTIFIAPEDATIVDPSGEYYANKVYYYWLNNDGTADGGIYNFYAPFEGPDPVLMSGEFIELKGNVTLTKDVTYLQECSFGDPIYKGGTFTLIFGNYGIDLNSYAFVLPLGVSCITDKQTNIFSAPEGYEVRETYDAIENTYFYDVVRYVAQIDNDKYETLEAAIAAVPADGAATVILLTDIDLANDPLTVEGYAAIAPAGKTVTLDLNSHAITGGALDVYGTLIIDDGTTDKLGSVTAANKHAVWVNEGAKLTVNAGTLTAGSGYAVVVDSSEATIAGGTVQTGSASGGTVKVQGTGELEVTGGQIKSTVADASAIDAADASTVTVSGGQVISIDYGVSMFGTSTLTVSGTAQISAADGFGVYTNGNADNNVTINVQGGSITGGDAGIYQPSGTVNVIGGTISGATGIFVRGGTLNIPSTSTAAISGTGAKAEPAFAPSGDGATGTGEAVTIVNSNYPTPISNTTIAGGTFTSANADAVGSYAINDTLAAPTGFISGGTFSSPVPEELCAEGYESADNGDGTYTVETIKVAQIGTTKYATLAAAFAAVQPNETITILKDFDESGTVRSFFPLLPVHIPWT